MKSTLVALLLLSCALAFGQSPAVDLALTVNDGASGSRVLRFGIDPSATDGINASLGEVELPPLPPAGVFDARFVGTNIGVSIGQGLAKDYRQGEIAVGGTRIYEVRYQVGTGTVINIGWDLPVGVSGVMQDFVGGVVINASMSGTGGVTVTNPGVLTSLKMTIQYDAGLPIRLGSFDADRLNARSVLLHWKTLTEVDNYGFEVEKSIQAPDAFIVIPNSFIAGAGTSIEPRDYSYTDHAAESCVLHYRLKQIDRDGQVHYSEPILVDLATAIEELTVAREFKLFQNYPNPFNPSTVIRFSVRATAHTRLEAFDLTGRSVAVLYDGIADAGRYYALEFSGVKLSSGVYVYQLESGDVVLRKRMILLR